MLSVEELIGVEPARIDSAPVLVYSAADHTKADDLWHPVEVSDREIKADVEAARSWTGALDFEAKGDETTTRTSVDLGVIVGVIHDRAIHGRQNLARKHGEHHPNHHLLRMKLFERWGIAEPQAT